MYVHCLCVQTLDLGLAVEGYEAVHVSGGFADELQRRVEEGQEHGGQLLAHFLRVEVPVGPLVCVVAAGELGHGAGGSDGGVVGVEGGVNDQPPVVHQAGIVDGFEGVVVDAFGGKVQKNLQGIKFFS